MSKSKSYFLGAVFLAVVSSIAASCVTQSTTRAVLQPSLREYAARAPLMRKQIPAVVKSAQAAAERILAHPDALIDVPYWEQAGFSEEMINRAGGLALAYPAGASGITAATKYDVVLLAVRSWEKDGATIRKKSLEAHTKGSLVTLIASKEGRPDDVPFDYFIDNGAPSGAAEHGKINALVNVALGWMWCCEYVSAMTRHGKIPGVLLSIALPGADEYDAKIQSPEGRHWVGDCGTPIPAGRLSELYLKRVQQLIVDLRSRERQEQIQRAADIVASRMKAGGTVGVSTVGHVTIFELLEKDMKAPWKRFQAVNLEKTAFKENLKRGDLLLWVGYMGINSKYADFARYINEPGADVITCYSPQKESYGTVSNVVAHIDQSWAWGDAEVPLPCPPGKMAPISGINGVLIFRMLDDEVSARLGR
jgi:uncharacterized phosphosugar-binding protein